MSNQQQQAGVELSDESAAELLGFVRGVHFAAPGLELSAFSNYNKDRIALVQKGWRAAIAADHQQQPTTEPVDPLDWPLPCDVTVGHGTMRKGVALRSLVSRMKVLYEIATGNNADAVANRTPDQRAALQDEFLKCLTPPQAEQRGKVEPVAPPEVQAAMTVSAALGSNGWYVWADDSDGNSTPKCEYPNAVKAAARMLQMMEIAIPVTPQSWPERIQIGGDDELE